MKEIKTLNELHSILLKIAEAFHQICEKNNIPYYMLGGTMLGAIRHKGFIPWDDDMDFGVPRIYFAELYNILKKNLPPQYDILSKNDGIIATGFYKIVDNRTIHTTIWNDKTEGMFGVNIDIFPLDYVCHKWKRSLIDFLLRMQGYIFFIAKDRPFHKRIAAYFLKLTFFWLNRDSITNFIEKYLIDNKGPYISNTYGIYGIKEIVPKEYFGNPTLMSFESTSFWGVEKAHDYLTSIYGDYMKMPSKEKLHTHIINMYWK